MKRETVLLGQMLGITLMLRVLQLQLFAGIGIGVIVFIYCGRKYWFAYETIVILMSLPSSIPLFTAIYPTVVNLIQHPDLTAQFLYNSRIIGWNQYARIISTESTPVNQITLAYQDNILGAWQYQLDLYAGIIAICVPIFSAMIGFQYLLFRMTVNKVRKKLNPYLKFKIAKVGES